MNEKLAQGLDCRLEEERGVRECVARELNCRELFGIKKELRCWSEVGGEAGWALMLVLVDVNTILLILASGWAPASRIAEVY